MSFFEWGGLPFCTFFTPLPSPRPLRKNENNLRLGFWIVQHPSVFLELSSRANKRFLSLIAIALIDFSVFRRQTVIGRKENQLLFDSQYKHR